MMPVTGHMSPLRQRRLSRGWEPVQLVGRMKILAGRDGLYLPKTYLLLRLMFLWENQRVPVPGLYAELMHRVFTTPTGSGTRCAVAARVRKAGRVVR